MDIEKILQQMTPEEKADFCSGSDFWHTQPVERLGVPAVMMSDGPSGLRKQDEQGDHLGINESIPAVCFPSSAAVASSFDTALAEKLGNTLGNECRAENLALLLGPGLGGTAQSAARAAETQALVQQLLPVHSSPAKSADRFAHQSLPPPKLFLHCSVLLLLPHFLLL